ncbi:MULTISPECIES: RNA polymerase sigma factor [Nocardioides]|uniref:RNA polymerase sigma-70 factor, ECF subfamily n=1 Tax=Nocardioides lianchengensis TaxID=1045774 RepID=A0A1G6KVS8_9ACTN|nr:sigma-70 family RNA polymerase sigma factor [Nocardioides lianchengensis]NYG13718.1 RNA polymerase sigma-70 factor (ECF subfamily) [Nocardioides lianchengensis]SDC35209.1 RNA polymerase sigma-70 factor, ECF subfamily [Nocardioides lianchengensis]
MDELYRRHGPVVFRYARSRLDTEDAHDVTAEVFVVALRRWREVPEHELAWLLGVARRVIANHVRSARRRTALGERLRAQRTPEAVDPARSVDRTDALRRAVATLGPRDQEVVGLLLAADLDQRDLAAALGCSPNTASARASRARRRLRDALAAQDSEHDDDTEGVFSR